MAVLLIKVVNGLFLALFLKSSDGVLMSVISIFNKRIKTEIT